MLTGCSWLATTLTPPEVVDAVARGDAVAQTTLVLPPETDEDRTAYYGVNAELWRQLAIWFELRAPDSE